MYLCAYVFQSHSVATNYFKFKALLQKDSWLNPAYVGVDEKGLIQYLSNHAPENGIGIEAVEGFALPGFQNAHSHAFQYAMAGVAEHHSLGSPDDFWTWRETMYRCALSVNPDQAEAIAAMVYAEMLGHGYTHVAEFHYLHHDQSGKPYDDPSEMGERMITAAKTSGIKITLVPVFYQTGNFGIEPLPHQRRFISASTEDYFKLLEASHRVVRNNPHAHLGFGVHSLRAVGFQDIIKTFRQGPKELPFHLHIAEQMKEVSDCLAYSGKRPVQWLLENLPVNERFHLVHATHLDDDELRKLAGTGANAVLCPSTEGNLGDGIFRMKEYVKSGGHWSIGTDSHIGLNPLEEFRMLDYRQRLVTHDRNTFNGDGGSCLISESIESGRKAMGLNFGNHFALGQPLDAVVYDAGSPLPASTPLRHLPGTLVYSAGAGVSLGTLVDGKWIVRNQRHLSGSKIRSAFSRAIREIGIRG
jgi:formimidoylglutamate deiminase